MKKGIFVFFYLLLTFCGWTQTTKTILRDNRIKGSMNKVVQNSIKAFMNDTSRVGVSVGVYYNGKIFTYNYGSTEKEKSIKPTSNANQGLVS